MHAAQNYIYIIFAVLYVIYSIVKAAKKVTQNRPTINKTPQQSPTVQPPTASPLAEQNKEIDFKKILEDLLVGNREEKIPEPQILKPKPTPVAIKPQPIKIVTNTKKEKTPVSHLHPIVEKAGKPFLTSEQKVKKKVFEEVMVAEESVADFDIRQAIIYSEILKRPEY